MALGLNTPKPPNQMGNASTEHSWSEEGCEHNLRRKDNQITSSSGARKLDKLGTVLDKKVQGDAKLCVTA